MTMSDSALLMTVADRVKRSEREHVLLTSRSLAQELAVLDVPDWRVESAIYSLEHSRQVKIGEDGFLRSMVPPPNRGKA